MGDPLSDGLRNAFILLFVCVGGWLVASGVTLSYEVHPRITLGVLLLAVAVVYTRLTR